MTEYHIGNVGRGEVPTVTDEERTTGAWFDLHRQMRQDLVDARRWAAVWKAKELRCEIKKLAEFKAQQCSTCSKYWGCKWAYHLDGCSKWEAITCSEKS